MSEQYWKTRTEMAVRNAGRTAAVARVRWAHVAYILGVGSTSAHRLCIDFGLDPDEIVGGCHACAEREEELKEEERSYNEETAGSEQE